MSIKTELQAAIAYCNQKLTAKGASEAATVYGIGDQIESISTGIEPQALTWQQTPTAVKNYLDNVTYNPSDYSTSQIANYAPATPSADNYYPVGKSVSLSAGTLERGGFAQSVSAGNVTLFNDIPNKRTPYTVKNGSGGILQAGTLMPNGGFLRQIKCTALNVRDIGGWACDGGTVKYGVLFRGGVPSANDREVFVNQLGIRTDIDLRGKSEAGITSSPLGSDVNYYVFDRYVWYSLTDTETWQLILRAVFDSVLKNKPVYFHCSMGADRTAALACVLEAVLGVSQSDIDKDYELTCFYSGTGSDSTARRRNESEWTGLITAINQKSGSTFRDKAVRYMLELGFTIDEINAFRAAVIDGTPETLTATLSSYTVSNSLTNAVSSNPAASATQFQPYSAVITPSGGCLITAITVTMGGADITQNSVTLIANGVDEPVGIISAEISIPSVSGNISVSVTAQETAPQNLFDINDATLRGRLNSSGAAVAYADGQLVSGFINAQVGDTIYFCSDKAYDANSYTGDMGMYQADGTQVMQFYNYATADGGWHWAADKLSGYITIPSNFSNVSLANVAKIRICIPYTDSDNIAIYKLSTPPTLN